MLTTELTRFSDDPRLALSGDFLREASKRGDLCFGVLHDGQLVAYRWYGLSGSTPAEPGFHFHYAHPARAYGYKAFTLPAHRGKRLQQHSVKSADAFMLEKGYTHVVGYIDERNFSSLRMNATLEGIVIGRAVTMSFLGKRFAANSRRAVRHGVRIATRP